MRILQRQRSWSPWRWSWDVWRISRSPLWTTLPTWGHARSRWETPMNPPTHASCTSLCSPWCVYLVWPHGKCSTSGDISRPKSSLSNFPLPKTAAHICFVTGPSLYFLNCRCSFRSFILIKCIFFVYLDDISLICLFLPSFLYVWMRWVIRQLIKNTLKNKLVYVWI